MTGARNYLDLGNGLSFNIGRNKSRANLVKILLNGDDTYTMQFWRKPREVNVNLLIVKYYEQGMSDEQIQKKLSERVKKSEPKILKEYDGIYCDQLESLFTEYTELYTHL